MTREPLDLRGINFEEGYIAVLDKPLRCPACGRSYREEDTGLVEER